MKPLDEAQQREFDLARAERAPWLRARMGTAIAGCLLGAITSGACVTGWVLAGGAWPVPVGLAVLFTLAVTLFVARLQPDEVLELIVRSRHPSSESYRRGVSAFQVDGGRVPKPGEKPPPPYWRK